MLLNPLARLSFLGVACALFANCNPREMPGFKQIAQREGARITRETDEAIKKSPALHELNQLCTRDIPLPPCFALAYKSRDFDEEKFLSYYYRASIEYKDVKRFYLDYLPPRNWQLAEQKDGGWGPSKLVFRREAYEVIIYDKEYGNDTFYSVVCRKL
jgi:hypothetical protein